MRKNLSNVTQEEFDAHVKELQLARDENRKPKAATHRKHGVGAHLHKLIKTYLGQKIIAGCGCGSMIEKMNTWGPDGCRKRIEEIIDYLEKIAIEKNWSLQPEDGVDAADIDIGADVPQSIRTRCLRVLACMASTVEVGEEFVRGMCRLMVERAITLAERDLLKEPPGAV